MTQLRPMDHADYPSFPLGNAGSPPVMKRLVHWVRLVYSQRRTVRTTPSSALDATTFCRARPNPPNFRHVEPN